MDVPAQGQTTVVCVIVEVTVVLCLTEDGPVSGVLVGPADLDELETGVIMELEWDPAGQVEEVTVPVWLENGVVDAAGEVDMIHEVEDWPPDPYWHSASPKTARHRLIGMSRSPSVD